MREITTKYCRITYHDDLIRILFFKGHEIGLAEAKDYCSIIKKLVEGTPFASISSAEPGGSWTSKAREYLAKHETSQYAAALVSNSRLMRLVGDFFIKISKPKYPTRFFHTVEEAEIWVEKMREEFFKSESANAEDIG